MVRRQPAEWEKITVSHLIKDCYTEYTRNINNRKNPILKNGQLSK
jgi:hypothetical protein